MVTAIQLGYISIFQGTLFTGVLKDYRIPILAGAFAILWVSINATWKILGRRIGL